MESKLEIKFTFLSNTLQTPKISKKFTTPFIKVTLPNEATGLKREEKHGIGSKTNQRDFRCKRRLQTMIEDAGGERRYFVLLNGNRSRQRRTWTSRDGHCDAPERSRRVAWEEARWFDPLLGPCDPNLFLQFSFFFLPSLHCCSPFFLSLSLPRASEIVFLVLPLREV